MRKTKCKYCNGKKITLTLSQIAEKFNYKPEQIKIVESKISIERVIELIDHL